MKAFTRSMRQISLFSPPQRMRLDDATGIVHIPDGMLIMYMFGQSLSHLTIRILLIPIVARTVMTDSMSLSFSHPLILNLLSIT